MPRVWERKKISFPPRTKKSRELFFAYHPTTAHIKLRPCVDVKDFFPFCSIHPALFSQNSFRPHSTRKMGKSKSSTNGKSAGKPAVNGKAETSTLAKAKNGVVAVASGVTAKASKALKSKPKVVEEVSSDDDSDASDSDSGSDASDDDSAEDGSEEGSAEADSDADSGSDDSDDSDSSGSEAEEKAVPIKAKAKAAPATNGAPIANGAKATKATNGTAAKVCVVGLNHLRLLLLTSDRTLMRRLPPTRRTSPIRLLTTRRPSPLRRPMSPPRSARRSMTLSRASGPRSRSSRLMGRARLSSSATLLGP
jgi:hypothetical protein